MSANDSSASGAPGGDGRDGREGRDGRDGRDGRTIGWVGLGALGLPMAARAVAAGWRVLGFDPSPVQREAAGAAGIDVVTGLAEVAASTGDVVVCVVRTLAQVEAVLLGEGGVQLGAEPPVAVVMSSVGAVGLAELDARVRERGARLVDAPVLGNPAGAAAGTLTIAVSGAPEDVALTRPVLQDLAQSVVVLGERVGLAQTVKMVSQLRQVIGMLATFEGVELAVRRGADEEEVLGLLSATEPSWATENWAYATDLWARRDRSTSLGIFEKDLAAAVADAELVDVDLPLTREALGLIEDRIERWDGNGEDRRGEDRRENR